MARRWILDTETKGTGAQMVPLEKAHDPAGATPRGPIVVREPSPPPEKAPAERAPRRFRVVDVMTRQVLADDVDTRGAIEALRGLRSVVDVTIYVWDDGKEAWEQLSQGDRGRMWALRHRV